MKSVYAYKDSSIEPGELSIKDIDGKKGIVTGYFSAFGNVDSDGDVIRRGAFSKTIKEMGPGSTRPRIKHLLNHDTRSPLGVLQELKEDTKGLYYESQIGRHSLGEDFIKMVESGLITEHSIGIQIMKRNQLQDYDSYRNDPSAGWWEITEAKLWEGSSLTAWGANPLTPLTGLKSEQKADMVSKRIDLLIKALKDGTFTDETFHNLEIELRQLQQFALDLLNKATEPENSTLPGKADKAIVAINNFIQTLQ